MAEERLIYRAWRVFSELRLWSFGHMLWNIGVNDPKKAFHALKVGLAVTLVSIFYYVRPLYEGVAGSAMGSVLTVAVVFEFNAGGTICRAFNRTSATFIAGFLAIGIHIIADRSNKEIGHIVHGIAVFLIALAATFARFIPVVKARYDYGMLVFIVTFTMISLSGHHLNKLLDMAKQRSFTIALGSFICVLVSVLICPVWAGKELHILVVGNMEKLANSLEVCVLEYTKQGQDSKGKEDSPQKLPGYRSVLASKASEDRLVNLARWEPPHGQFGMSHPWKHYLKIGASMRYCASCMETLHSYTKSEGKIQAPEIIKDYLCSAFMRLSFNSSIVLKELAKSANEISKSSTMDDLVKDMKVAADELQVALRTLPRMILAIKENQTRVYNGELKDINLNLVEVIPLATVTSLLMEITTRIEGTVSTVNDFVNEALLKTL
ncbi:aluminum-activated malate transporter 10-like [Dendrobium catenatum]|uniref:Aluminum-activated malate transporter 10 n=1 Tax=Dendrobium catenatum TaxID=906689 RepID=A0A2I0WTS3_9ASPA|nr:aluminum-activated malate transporter 10-like [Dendrobium catenatum]PKU79060.1 Aluminum-activated malate transporter 10 [Dendrobium catenatum]